MKTQNDLSSDVLSPEQMQVLKNKGVDISDGKIFWVRRIMDWAGETTTNSKWSLSLSDRLVVMNFENFEIIPTYTVNDIINKISYQHTQHAEITMKFPSRNKYKLSWKKSAQHETEKYIEVEADNLITAYYKLYINLIDEHEV